MSFASGKSRGRTRYLHAFVTFEFLLVTSENLKADSLKNNLAKPSDERSQTCFSFKISIVICNSDFECSLSGFFFQ